MIGSGAAGRSPCDVSDSRLSPVAVKRNSLTETAGTTEQQSWVGSILTARVRNETETRL